MSGGLINGRVSRPEFKLLVVSVLLAGAAGGCGSSGGAGSMPSLIPVKGKVTFKGQPLTSGTITFAPDDYGGPARGELQPDGTFVLTTSTSGDGVVAGHHRVYITGVDSKSKTGALPKKYSAPTTSKLEAEVSPDNTEFTFDIR
jgi:hypothetical protein